MAISFSIADDFRPVSTARTTRDARVLLLALLAAVLLHAFVILSVLLEWPDMGRPIERRDIPVELVFDDPSQTPPKSAQSQETPPPLERESGGDPNLAPGRTAEAAAQPAAPPEPPGAKPTEAAVPLPEPVDENIVAEFAPPLRKPAPPSPPVPPKPAEVQPAPPQPAPPAATAKAEPRLPSRLSVIGQGGGDTYLNQIRDLIEKQRSYPDIGNPMRLAGVAIYEIRLNRDGEIVNVLLLRSTGAGPLDEEGRKIVRRAGPFPPIPPNIPSNLPGNLVGLRLDLPIHP